MLVLQRHGGTWPVGMATSDQQFIVMIDPAPHGAIAMADLALTKSPQGLRIQGPRQEASKPVSTKENAPDARPVTRVDGQGCPPWAGLELGLAGRDGPMEW